MDVLTPIDPTKNPGNLFYQLVSTLRAILHRPVGRISTVPFVTVKTLGDPASWSMKNSSQVEMHVVLTTARKQYRDFSLVSVSSLMPHAQNRA
jgi:hypothetical protein